MWLFEMLHIIFSGICEFWLHRKKNREEWNDKTRTVIKLFHDFVLFFCAMDDSLDNIF